ncbi:hypothetical protein jhhlp_002971 [Lomentospora prolificans]|uniref:RRM domain-containing protein n=1 Tax=Lomentospora prolificans TaxID=41688 RepID=A0A2N3NFI8_9PEZI|nr:hypothetical protein jhhlp_002971 [Lomentospora prolificans]
MSTPGAEDETPGIHTIANLSPVSPSPLTATTVAALPALESQAESLDDAGMVQANTIASMTDNITVAAFAIAAGQVPAWNGDDDTGLDDDLYGESEQEGALHSEPTAIDQAATEMDDEYAKTFDSPLTGEEEGEDGTPESEKSNNGLGEATKSEVSGPLNVSSSLVNSNAPEASKPAQPSVSSTSTTVTLVAAHPSHSATALSSADIPMTHSSPSPKPNSEVSAKAMGPSSFSNSNVASQQTDLVASSRDDEAKGSPSLVPTAGPNNHSGVDLTGLPQASANTPRANGALTLPPASADLPSRPPVDMNRIHFDIARTPAAQAGSKVGPSPSSSAVVNTAAPGLVVSASLSSSAPGHLPPPPPGTTESMAALGPPPGPTNPSLPQGSLSTTSPSSNTLVSYPGSHTASADPNTTSTYRRMWDQYIADEKRYMAEQKWDRFPEGSRVFIGNLSSDKVSKRDVFDLFHRFGRLAQISLKSAFGFVQYHTLEEARAAVDNLQGVEVKGRKIHLEFSRTQKKKEQKDERARSPDRGPRSREPGHKGGRYDGGGRRSRDEIRQGHGRHGSDYRSHHREDSYGRDRQYDNYRSRDRSLSPRGRGKEHRDRDAYRYRSRSPYNSSRHSDESRSYGHDTGAPPDVQLLLLQEVDPNFVNWVRGAFVERGLRIDVMIVNPAYHIKKDVISRLVVDGVSGIVELDFNSQDRGEVYLHLYDLSRGLGNVSFNEYQGLKPATAADLVMRTKSKPPYQPTPTPYGGVLQGGFYGQPPSAHPVATTGAPAYHAQQGPSTAPVSGAGGGVDLQQILSQLQKPGSTPVPHATGNVPTATAAPGPIDIQAILGQLNGGAPPFQSPPARYPGSVQYPAAGNPNQAPAFGQQQTMPPTGPSAQGTDVQVQNIMAQLARFRQ